MTPSERFAVIMTFVGMCAATLGWFIRRLVNNYDEAQVAREAAREKLDAERRAALERHTQANHDATAALAAALAANTKEFGERLVAAQEATFRAIGDVNVRMAKWEGIQPGDAGMGWQGAARPRHEACGGELTRPPL